MNVDDVERSGGSAQSVIVAVDARTAGGLVEEFDRLRRAAEDGGDRSLLDISVEAVSRLGSGGFRCAVLVESKAALPGKLERAERFLEELDESARDLACEETVYVGRAREEPEVGFVFPGQGSQFPGMGEQLQRRFDWARDLVDRANQVVGDFDGRGLSEYVMPTAERGVSEEERVRLEKRLVSTEIAQPGICLVSMLWNGRLRALGVEPSVVAGHSLGELTAFYAAGLLDRDQFLELAALRGRAMAETDGEGAMAAMRCDRERARELIDGIDGEIVVANLNTPKQTVVSGTEDAVDNAVRRAFSEREVAKVLPVSDAFHSSLVEESTETLREEANVSESSGAPEVPVVSSVTGDTIDEKIDLRSYLAEQVTKPVDFISVSEVMIDRADLIVEVGPGDVLTGFVTKNAEDAVTVLPTETAVGDASDLHRLLATAHAMGLELEWDRL